MIIFCPKCQLRGEIVDAPEAAFCLRVTCVRCSSAFIVTAINDEALIVLDKTSSGKLPSASAAIADAIAQTTPAATTATAAARPAAKSAAGDDTPLPPRPSSLRERIALADAPASSTPQRRTAEAAASSPTMPTPVPAATARPAADSFDTALYSQPATMPQMIVQPVDGYDTGSRLLRVSPLWWLAAGVAVAAFVIFCNWLIGPGTNSRDAAVNLSRPLPRGSSAGNSTANQDLTAPTEDETTSDDDLPAAPSPALITPQGTNDASGGRGAGFTVQLGSFNKIEEAQELIASLAATGISARLDARPASKKKVWYRVHSGLFASHDEAAAYGRQLRAQKAAPDFVVTSTN